MQNLWVVRPDGPQNNSNDAAGLAENPKAAKVTETEHLVTARR
jgi:hypothetical protein